MAGPACMSDDGNAAVFVGTFLQDGSSVALCNDCLPQFMVAVLAQMEGIEIEALAAEIVRLAGNQPDDPAAAASEVAYPPHMTTEGAPTDEPPEPAPADTDIQDEGSHANYPTTRRTTSNESSDQPTGTGGTANESPPTNGNGKRTAKV